MWFILPESMRSQRKSGVLCASVISSSSGCSMERDQTHKSNCWRLRWRLSSGATGRCEVRVRISSFDGDEVAAQRVAEEIRSYIMVCPHKRNKQRMEVELEKLIASWRLKRQLEAAEGDVRDDIEVRGGDNTHNVGIDLW